MPLLNDDGQVCGLETLGSLSEKPSFDNPVFLMAGGFGKRLHPLTLQTPKPLLKVGNKPILEMILESFIEAGFHNFYISTFYEAEQLKNHFGDGDKWNVSINYIDENHPLGTAGSLGLLPPDLPDHPLIMMNGDLLTRVDYAKLLQYHDESKGDATICVREYDFQVPFGVVKGNGIKVEEIQEKPIYSFFVNAGIYVLEPDFYKNLGNADYLDMPDLLQHRLADGAVINMYPIHEYWLDIGRMEDFKQANLDASLFR
jgi:NDP-sugar pyrophosphorylase family protein